MFTKRVGRAGVVLALTVGLALAVLQGCAAGTAAGPAHASFPECMNASNPTPWWQTYPCSQINSGGAGGM